MTLATMLDKQVQINSLSATSSGGARKKSFATVKYPLLPAAIQPRSSKNAALFKESGLQITHVVYLGDPSGGYGFVSNLNINQGDQISYTPLGSTTARIFEITGVRNPDEANAYLICGCVERKG